MSEIAERCAPFEVDLSALIDDQLDAPRASEVQAHAGSCRDCARRIAALRAVDGELQRLAAAPADPIRIEALRSTLASRLGKETGGGTRVQTAPPAHRAPVRRRRWLVPVALTATAAAAAALVFVTRPNAPAIAPASEVVVAKQAAPKSRADAEVAARKLNAGLDTPIGASTPSEEELDATSAFGDLPPQTREKLREKLAAMKPEERAQLLTRISQLRELSPQQRGELRESLAQLGVLSPEEQQRILR
jgi:anti-sigma factor RsiW